MRIDGSRISVKMPTCPTDTVGTVEVYDSDSEKLLWRASGPKTPEGKRGVVTLWNADDFLKASSGTQPKALPANLDISVTFAGTEDGTGDVFNVHKVQAAHVADGQYWTRSGARTAAQIDAQLGCRWDGTARVWDLSSGLRGELTGHRRGLRTVSTAVIDGRPSAISCSDDGTARVWNLLDGSAPQVLQQGNTPVTCAASYRRPEGTFVVCTVGGRPHCLNRQPRSHGQAVGSGVGHPGRSLPRAHLHGVGGRSQGRDGRHHRVRQDAQALESDLH
ncbi:WD40 repeat domain-containing protein [Streptomyces sp. NPDC054813]